MEIIVIWKSNLNLFALKIVFDFNNNWNKNVIQSLILFWRVYYTFRNIGKTISVLWIQLCTEEHRETVAKENSGSLFNLSNRNPSWDSFIECSSKSQLRLINKTITYYNVALVSWGHGNIFKNSKIPHFFPASIRRLWPSTLLRLLDV